MNFVDKFLPAVGTVLIVDNRVGSGHIEARKQIESQIKTNHVALNVITREIYDILVGDTIGAWLANGPNQALKNEDTQYLDNILTVQFLDVWVLTYYVFIKYLYLFLVHDVKVVISTQPVGNKGLILAARIANYINRTFRGILTPIRAYGVLTDFVTKDSEPFLYGYKNYNSEERKIFKLIAPKPRVLGNRETEEEFWKKNFNLSVSNNQVFYDEMPIRSHFNTLDTSAPIDDLYVQVSSEEELRLINNCSPDAFSIEDDGKRLKFHINDEDEVGYVMLGGQAAISSTKNYVKEFIEYAKAFKDQGNDRYFFVLCGKHEEKDSLFEQVHDLVQIAKKSPDYPSDLHIVPLTYQTDAEIAPMICRSQYPVIKPGGIGSFEANKVAKGQIFIHSSYKGNPYLAKKNDLMNNLIAWERPNAETLMKEKGAILTTPKAFAKYLSDHAKEIQAKRRVASVA